MPNRNRVTDLGEKKTCGCQRGKRRVDRQIRGTRLRGINYCV